MIQKLTQCTILVAGGLLLATAVAQEENAVNKSDWLTTTAGSVEEKLGARVLSVEEEAETTIVELEVPVEDPDAIENIEVVGRTTGRLIEQSEEAEWLIMYESGNYGLRIHLDQPAGFDFLIQFNDRDVMDTR